MLVEIEQSLKSTNQTRCLYPSLDTLPQPIADLPPPPPAPASVFTPASKHLTAPLHHIMMHRRYLLTLPSLVHRSYRHSSLRCCVAFDGGRQHQHRDFHRRFLTSSPPPPIKQDDSDDTGKDTTAKEPANAAIPNSIVPGIALSAATATAGFQVASILSSSLSLPLSGIPTSILLGMAINNTIGYSKETFQPGITYSTKTLLQGGIVAVAAKLSFFELLSAGSAGLPVVVASVGAGLLFIPVAGRLAGLPTEMSLLLTAGTSICGVTAITAL